MDDIQRIGITSITIENFKGIGPKVTIPLKPITLLFGANSAGKSTILQALLYAHEVLNHRNPNADVTEFGGDVINLGGFRNLVHGHDMSKAIKIGLDYRLSDDGLPTYGLGRSAIEEISDDLLYSDEAFQELNDASVEFTIRSDENSIPYVAEYMVNINGKPTAKITAKGLDRPAFLTFLELDEILDAGSFLPEVEAALHAQVLSASGLAEQVADLLRHPEQAETRDKVSPSKWLREDLRRKYDLPEYGDSESDEEIAEKLSRLFIAAAEEDSPIRLPDGALPRWGELIPFQKERLQEVGEGYLSKFSALLSAIISGPGELVANEVKNMRYIGPVRSMPPRGYSPQKTSSQGRWSNGMAGWDVLLNDILEGETWFVEPIYRSLNLGYEFLPCQELTLSVDSFETLAKEPLKKVQKHAVKQAVVRMRHMKSKTHVEPCDVGTGVSQVIPVVAGAMAPGCRFLCVEQPELHLHPAIQCNLGDLFIALMNRYPERTFLLETHSEHLILRLLRRIRESASPNVEDPKNILAPEQLAVLYVEEVEDGVRISELRVDEQGQFIDEWPNGFFEEDFDEIMGGL